MNEENIDEELVGMTNAFLTISRDMDIARASLGDAHFRLEMLMAAPRFRLLVPSESYFELSRRLNSLMGDISFGKIESLNVIELLCHIGDEINKKDKRKKKKDEKQNEEDSSHISNAYKYAQKFLDDMTQQPQQIQHPPPPKIGE